MPRRPRRLSAPLSSACGNAATCTGLSATVAHGQRHHGASSHPGVWGGIVDSAGLQRSRKQNFKLFNYCHTLEQRSSSQKLQLGERESAASCWCCRRYQRRGLSQSPRPHCVLATKNQCHRCAFSPCSKAVKGSVIYNTRASSALGLDCHFYLN